MCHDHGLKGQTRRSPDGAYDHRGGSRQVRLSSGHFASGRPGHGRAPIAAQRRSLPFFAQQPAATVLLEACGSAHHWARHSSASAIRRGCSPPTMCIATSVAIRPIAPMRRPYSKRLAMTRSAQCQSIDRSASRGVAPRVSSDVALDADRPAESLRGVCREFGIIIPVGATRVIPAVRAQLAPGGALPTLLVPALEALCAEIAESGSGHGRDRASIGRARGADARRVFAFRRFRALGC